ncbi:MAG: helix-turn-helix transcriptional regulator [Clostridia bacterium]|nr:helix-turn-helix transcriptional regulator [Clostridia bacterium]
MKTIGENIAYFRKKNKLTQEELAEKLSVTSQAVSKWECDSSYPDITSMQALAKSLGVTVDELINGEQQLPEVSEAPKEQIDRRIVLINVKATDTTVTTRLPVSFVKKSIANGMLKKIVGEEAFENMGALEDMIDSGLTGTFVEVDNPEAQISIKVVDYDN